MYVNVYRMVDDRGKLVKTYPGNTPTLAAYEAAHDIDADLEPGKDRRDYAKEGRPLPYEVEKTVRIMDDSGALYVYAVSRKLEKYDRPRPPWECGAFDCPDGYRLVYDVKLL
jgi:hypothetical protein